MKVYNYVDAEEYYSFKVTAADCIFLMRFSSDSSSLIIVNGSDVKDRYTINVIKLETKENLKPLTVTLHGEIPA